MVRYIVYTSRARPGLLPVQIDTLLKQARDFNAHVRVSGVLLYDGHRFFQYLEGTPYATDEAMWRIRHSQSHHDIRVLADALTPTREFDRWYMGFCQTTASHFQLLENAVWQPVLHHKRSRDDPSPALAAPNEFLSQRSVSPGLALMTSQPHPSHA